MKDRELLRRVITGSVVGLVIIACTLGGAIPSFLLVVTIVAGSCIEYFRLHKPFSGHADVVLPSVLCVIPIVSVCIMMILDQGTALSMSLVFIISFAIVFTIYFLFQMRFGIEKLQIRLQGFGLSLILFALPGFFAVMMINQESPKLLLGLFILLWSCDVFAYFGGRAFGKHKLAPSISPKKTWEGFVCGLVATMGLAWVLSLFFTEITLLQWIVTAILVVIFGVLGDLMQSAIKRSAGVKDSGKLLPGHGGIWDRFDSFLGCVTWVGMYYMIF